VAGESEQGVDTRPVTVLDVLEGFFGGIPDEAAVRALDQHDIEELGDLAVQSAAAQATAQVPKGAVYPGGWLAGNWHEQLFRGELTLALLYYSALLVHDPLADFFFRDYGSLPPTRELRERRNRMTISGGPAVWGQAVSYEGMRSNPDAVLDYLVKVITFLVDAAPLLRSSALITRSQWPTILDRSQALMTSVRNDVRSREMQSAVAGAAAAGDPVPTWDNIRGLNVLPVGGLRASDEPWQWQHEFFYLAKTLAVADAVGATYAPPTNGDLAVLRVKVAQAQRAVVGDRQPRRAARRGGSRARTRPSAGRAHHSGYANLRGGVRRLALTRRGTPRPGPAAPAAPNPAAPAPGPGLSARCSRPQLSRAASGSGAVNCGHRHQHPSRPGRRGDLARSAHRKPSWCGGRRPGRRLSCRGRRPRCVPGGMLRALPG